MNPDKTHDKNMEPGFPFFRKIGAKYVLTNDCGNYAVVTEKEFSALRDGELKKTSRAYKTLFKNDLLPGKTDADRMAARYRGKNRHLTVGPNLHIVIVTLRCNESCVYCHAGRGSMKKTSLDMSVETAKNVVDTIFQTTSPSITIEFQGGEPLANWDVVEFIVKYATEKNTTFKKSLTFSLVTNLSLMDEKKAEFLLDSGVLMCTSLDGPEDLHDLNRKCPGGSAYKKTVSWMKRINEGYAKRGVDTNLYHVDALLTVTKDSLKRPKEIIDEYVRHGIKVIHLRPLNPMGFAVETWDRIGYTPSEFLRFYNESLDYIIELNNKGTEILERMSSIFLTKILTERDPNFLDIRSPCGAGIGQLAYNYDGTIFTCDEGRMVNQMGDDIFALGVAGSTGYKELVSHDTVKTIATASCLDGLPMCESCAYKPYCGVCPVINYLEQGDLFGQRPRSSRCAIHMGVMDRIFTLIATGGDDVLRIFGRWVTYRQRQAQ